LLAVFFFFGRFLPAFSSTSPLSIASFFFACSASRSAASFFVRSLFGCQAAMADSTVEVNGGSSYGNVSFWGTKYCTEQNLLVDFPLRA